VDARDESAGMTAPRHRISLFPFAELTPHTHNRVDDFGLRRRHWLSRLQCRLFSGLDPPVQILH
jgi:hypothetical protein